MRPSVFAVLRLMTRKARGLLNRDIARFCSFQNLIDEHRHLHQKHREG